VSRLPSLSSKQIIKALRRAGFTEAPDRGKGSHRGRDIPKGTLLAIIDQAGMTREEFLKFL